MKIKGSKFGGGSRTKLGLPWISLLCLSFFLAGFSGSYLFSHQDIPRPPERRMEEENMEFEALSHGESGEESVAEIPFQRGLQVSKTKPHCRQKNLEVMVFGSSKRFIIQTDEILSWNPRALYFPNFATAEQCQSIIEMAKRRLTPSSLALRGGETAESTQGTRTSSGMFVSSSDDKTGILDQIETKIAKATLIPKKHGEAFNVLRYEIGQRYHSHYDAFNPAEYGPQKSQRLASFLLYLSDVREGGETMFPFENGQNMDYNYNFRQCVGLKVKPRRGDGLLFYSLFPNGTIDPTSLHGSCPVIKGEKWVATKWIRNQEQDGEY